METVLAADGSSVIYRPQFVILSGCSGGGKSTLLTELAHRGFQTIAEPGRELVREQLDTGGEALPWQNLDQFMKLVLEKNIANFHAALVDDGYVFFDRSVVDAIGQKGELAGEAWAAALHLRYHAKVFMVPPWEEIYVNDAERQHSFADAQAEYATLLANYTKLGYDVVVLPKGPVNERVAFLLARLSAAKEPEAAGDHLP